MPFAYLRALRFHTRCGHHMRVGAVERLAFTFDEGSYTRIELPKVVADPLRFRDTKRRARAGRVRGRRPAGGRGRGGHSLVNV
jgi:acetyl-CoA carboxylase beta subunit